MPALPISFTVNGQKVALQADGRRRLLDVLREDLGLTGTKEGCGQGDCGSCSVLVDGVPQNACLLQVRKVAGREITTIEGLGTPTQLHPIQQAFVQAGAIQCGYCTPGMVIRTKALLDRNRRPSEQDIRQAFSKNLCRCTGYVKIVEAVRQASALLKGEAPKVEARQGVVGTSVQRVDALDKVTGRAPYAADLKQEGMLYAKVLRSPHPHARILAIDTGEAERFPGVAAILTAKDIPGAKRVGPGKDQPVLAEEKVCYVGDPVAVVAATSPEVARKALALIRVDYQPLEALFDPLFALREDAPQIHPKGNLMARRQIVKGDIERGFQEAEVVVENTFTAPLYEHAYMEPDAGISYLDEIGRLVLRGPAQDPHSAQRELAAVLGLEVDRVRVIPTTIGGGFGGRGGVATYCLVCLLTYKLGKPVKLVYTRRETFVATSKCPSFQVRNKMGATREGRLTAAQVDILINGGAYWFNAPVVLARATIHSTGPYYVPHVLVEAKAVYTNAPPGGQIRGFGVPQVALAFESQMDIIAGHLGMDPWQIRLLNSLVSGSETSIGQVLGKGAAMKKTLKAIKPYYDKSVKLLSNQDSAAPVKRGVGLGCMWKHIGRLGGPNYAQAYVELRPDGVVQILTGASEIGQGALTILAQVAAEEMGLPFQCVRVISGDTALTPDCGGASASRQTFLSGNAVKRAAHDLRVALLTTGARALEKRVEDLEFRDSHLVYSRDPSVELSLPELAAFCQEAGTPLRYTGRFETDTRLDRETGQGTIENPPVFSTHLAEVEVNTRTGEVKVLRVVAAQDMGRVVHPLNVEGQVEGGVVMGLGMALKEEYILGKTNSFAHYQVPIILDVPKVVPLMVEVPEPLGPFGAKGGGENTAVSTVPAIINAIYNACGARIYDLPATPKRVLQALRGKI